MNLLREKKIKKSVKNFGDFIYIFLALFCFQRTFSQDFSLNFNIKINAFMILLLKRESDGEVFNLLEYPIGSSRKLQILISMIISLKKRNET